MSCKLLNKWDYSAVFQDSQTTFLRLWKSLIRGLFETSFWRRFRLVVSTQLARWPNDVVRSALPSGRFGHETGAWSTWARGGAFTGSKSQGSISSPMQATQFGDATSRRSSANRGQGERSASRLWSVGRPWQINSAPDTVAHATSSAGSLSPCG